MKYQYLGFDTRTYMDIVVPGKGSLVAEPGKQYEFPGDPPSDGFWVPVPSKKAVVKEEASK